MHDAVTAKHQPGACAGDPISWRHFQYGLAYLGRDHLRTQLQVGEAVRLAGTKADDFNEWHRDIGRRLTPHLLD